MPLLDIEPIKLYHHFSKKNSFLMFKKLLLVLCLGTCSLFLAAQTPFTIAEVTTNDVDGLAQSIGVNAELTGIVYGINLLPDGLLFTLIDETGGIAVSSEMPIDDYLVAEGDQVQVVGFIAQNNGLTVVVPQTITLLNSGNLLQDAATVSALDETTESEFIRLECMELTDASLWNVGGVAGFAVEVNNGMNSYSLFIDADSDVFGSDAPEGVFHLTGIGSQSDDTTPYTEGYQISPRYLADIAAVTGPDATFTFTVTGSTAAFTANNASAGTYSWDFGDGLVVDLPIQSISHPYATDGEYMVCLTIVGEGDCGVSGSSTHCETVLIGDPPPPGIPVYDIGVVTTVDVEGIVDSIDVECEVRGVVHGINYRPQGLEFALIDETGGLVVYSQFGDLAYEVTEGDLLHVVGEIDQVNGVARLYADSIALVSSGNILQTPTVVSELNEDTEISMVTLECISLVNPNQWGGGGGPGGGSFNVDVTDGINEFEIRIDNASEVADSEAPIGTFNITGIGWQFDNNEPLTEDYQLYATTLADIEIVTNVNADFEFGFNEDDFSFLGAASSVDGADQITWDFGDGNTSTDGDVINTYAEPGFYTVCLTVSVSSDCGFQTFENCVSFTFGDVIFDIEDVTPVNTNGEAIAEGAFGEFRGIVYGVDFRFNGLHFFLKDHTDAIGVWTQAGDLGYDVLEGDSVHIVGEVNQVNGWTRIDAESVTLIDGGHPLDAPSILTTLDESSESQLVTVECLQLVDPDDWGAGGTFTVEASNGTDIFILRIDNDTDLFNDDAPTGVFSITGLVYQDDDDAPFDEGYQIMPRYATDITPVSEANGDFNYVVDSENLSINLEAVTTGEVDSVLWDLGDGNTATEPILSYTYDQIGTYEVCLTVYITTSCGQVQFTECIEEMIGRPVYDIIELTTTDFEGVADSIDAFGEIRGIVYGVNYRPQGLEFALRDATDGIVIYNGNGNMGYEVAEGDSIHVVGTIDQDNGLIVMNPDNIVFIDSGHELEAPTEITTLGEETEVELITMRCVQLVNPNDWETGGGGGGGGGSFVVEVTNGVDIIEVRVDNATDVLDMEAPIGTFHVTGIGWQDDNNDPYDTGYQLWVRYMADVEPVNSVNANFDIAIDGDALTVDLIAESVTEADSILWTLGDGTTSTEETLSYTYATFGTYTICLTAYTNSDCGQQAITDCITEMIGRPVYDIIDVIGIDIEGVADSIDVFTEVRGIVYGINYRPQGLEFALRDATGGLVVWSQFGDLEYDLAEGDSLHVVGELDQRSGMVHLNADEITFIDGGHELKSPTTVTALDESTEVDLIRLECLSLVDPNDWGGGGGPGGGTFTTEVTNGSETFVLQVDNASDVFDIDPPAGLFHIVGLGWQEDNNEPLDGNYVLQARYIEDIESLPTVDPSFTITQDGASIEAITVANLDDVAEISWNMGDGTVITDMGSVTHTYENNGSYVIILTIVTAECERLIQFIEVIDIVSVGIQDAVAAGLKWYPNPVQNTLTITAPQAIESLQVHNVMGQELLRMDAIAHTNLDIDMNNWHTGVYFVTAIVAGKSVMMKVVKE